LYCFWLASKVPGVPMDSFLQERSGMQNNCRLMLWEGDPQASITPMDPESLARQSVLWQSDLKEIGPWGQLPAPSLAEPTLPGRVWQAAQSAGDCKIIICGPCPSAMDVAWALSRKGLMDPWDSVLAVSQQAGRGRHHRSWVSPVGNLYAAWRWPHGDTLPGTKWGGMLSLLAGYLFADYLERNGLSIKIKWPNDLLLNNRKIGGILLEQQRGQIMVGIGINLAAHPEAQLLSDEFAVAATSFQREGLEARPLTLWRELATAGRKKFFQIVESMTPEEWITVLNQRMAWIGQTVFVKTGRSESYEAMILGLAEDGGLKLKRGPATRVIYSGSLISV